MTFRIAVVQPITHRPPEDEKNVADAVGAIERAAGEGAHFVCFPESYPGPWRMPAAYDPTAALAEAAAKHGVHVVFGTLEPIDAKAGTAYNLTAMAFPDGRAPARYRRSHPNGPWIYTGGKTWEFQYVAGGDYPVFDTVHGKVGLAMCSEVYMPEVTRALALRGAELIFMPAGVEKHRLWPTWRTLIFARAIENLAIVVTTQNLFDHVAARPRHGGGAGGNPVREHGRGLKRGRRQPRPGALSALDARRNRLVGELRHQAGPARSAMAAAGALRQLPSAAVARSGRMMRPSRLAVDRARAPRSRSQSLSSADTASPIDRRVAELRGDDAALKKFSAHARAGVYVIGGELVVLKSSPSECDPLFAPAEARALGRVHESVFLGLIDDAPRFGFAARSASRSSR